MTTLKKPLPMHAARTLMNRDPELRAWAENFLKERERAEFTKTAETGADFERHWRYVRPERMHEGAIEAVEAFLAVNPDRIIGGE